MNTIKVKTSKIKSNPNNPRSIKDNKFNKLVESIKEFPEMLEKRPLVCFEDEGGNYVVLGGNMRLKALKTANISETPIILANEWSENQKKQFIIKDNLSFGEWDWDMLANEWGNEELQMWGLDVWQPEDEVDYSVLDDFDIDEDVAGMQNNAKKAIQIEFDKLDYEKANTLINQLRKDDVYIGGLVLDALVMHKANNE